MSSGKQFHIRPIKRHRNIFLKGHASGATFHLHLEKCVTASDRWRCRGIVVWPLDSHAESPGSIPTVARYFYPSARHFIHIAALDPGV